LDTRTVISLCLAGALLVSPGGWAQQVSGPKSNLTQTGGGLKIAVVEGEGATNNIRSKTATPPVIEVHDDSDKPVSGAEVVFQLPAAGPGGVFHGWMRTQTARSDEHGRAIASGFTPNDEECRFNIKVTATSGSRTGSAVIGQSNTRSGGVQAKHSNKTLWVVLGMLAVGGVAAGVAATRGGSSSSAAVTNPVTITSGPISVGGPR
jgi:hypothetical protein